MSLWRYSFELINKELEVTRKKKQALDNLFAERKISQSTYDYLRSELAKAISELENNLKKLKERMATRAQELESQLSSLELLLASLEIHHAAGDVRDETYEKENKAILLGLEATKRELNDIRNSLQGPSAETPIEEHVTFEEMTSEKTETVEAERPSTEPEQTIVSYEESRIEEQKEPEVEEESPEVSPAASESESSESSMEGDYSTYHSDNSSNISSWETKPSTEY